MRSPGTSSLAPRKPSPPADASLSRSAADPLREPPIPRLATRDSRLATADWRLESTSSGATSAASRRTIPGATIGWRRRRCWTGCRFRPSRFTGSVARTIRRRPRPNTSAGFGRCSAARGLDLVLLGLGEDGHTASLFPGQAAVHETARWVVAVPAPDATMWRVTLTPAMLNAARNVTFVVSGASKAARLQQVLQGPFTPDVLPAQAIRPLQGRLTWMVDDAAAGQLRLSRTPT